jgi:hypothetical protein
MHFRIGVIFSKEIKPQAPVIRQFARKTSRKAGDLSENDDRMASLWAENSFQLC